MTTTAQLTELRSRRRFVRAIVVIGIAASIAANVVDSEDWISRCIAGWPPVALLLSLEVLTRVPSSRRLGAAGRVLATMGVAFAAGWLSYWHMAATVSQHGEHGSSAYVWPISVDGLMTIAAIALVELGARIRVLEVTDPPASVVPDLVPDMARLPQAPASAIPFTPQRLDEPAEVLAFREAIRPKRRTTTRPAAA